MKTRDSDQALSLPPEKTLCWRKTHFFRIQEKSLTSYHFESVVQIASGILKFHN
jgi:hypothetical protein